MAYEIKRFPFDGTVDADGHILEPADLWENYLERNFKPRALRICVDDEGFEYLEIDRKPSARSRRGSLGLLGAMGEENLSPSPERRYADSMPFGACDAGERLSLMDQENLEYCLLYPTIGLLWEVELTDPELSLAYCRAYNRWIADFCRGSDRLIPIAQLTLLDVEGSARELARAVKDGCRGAWVNPFNHNRVIHGDAAHDLLFATCCQLDVPIAIHPTFTPHGAAAGIFDWPRQGRAWGEAIWLRAIVQQALISFFSLGTLERFPSLRVGVLEAGSGWVGAMLDRMDAFSASLNIKRASATELFRRQCFISGDPDETVAPHTITTVGEDCFMWATDYPHPDHPHTWVDDLIRYAGKLPDGTREKVLGGNVKRIYRLP
ncbi:MAG: amidohydrolase family protein [Proteobacteria bacterium]|jgi:predicted TIM-barrel fold metal-dependent hydrolase|nr:amidohydrolase family protein [Pseudomonadota bacterium]MDA1300758.1 amidohydrolase family protein [Pseudomonadota bacterium]